MTNLEWVLENQEELVEAKLRENLGRATDIALGRITLAEFLSWHLTVYLEEQKLVEAQGEQGGDKHYIYSVEAVEEWLQAERKEPLKPEYEVGTVLKHSNGEWFFYNGVKSNTHIVVNSPQYVGYKNVGALYSDEYFKEAFTPVRACDVSDRYTGLFRAPHHKD